MHFVEVKGILLSQNRLNIYRGCQHGCIYCDTRSECYGLNHDFCDIEVKSNSLELLEKKLMSKRKKCMIGTGSMSDPYMPIEEKLNYTGRLLTLVNKYNFGISLITKSDLILRDIHILKSINDKAKAVVQMTLTTFDEELCRVIEPNVCSTKQRVNVLKELNKNGIPCVVWLSPILPFINDTEENLIGILNYCKEAGVRAIINFGFGLTLRSGNREYFYERLDCNFKGIKEKYIKTFGNAYECNSPNNGKLWSIFNDFCAKNAIENNTCKIFEYLSTYENTSGSEQIKFI